MRNILFKNFPDASGNMTYEYENTVLHSTRSTLQATEILFSECECAALRPSCSLYHCHFFLTFSVTKGPPRFTVLQWSIFVLVKENCCTRNFTNLTICARPHARVKGVWLQSAEVNFCISLYSFHTLTHT